MEVLSAVYTTPSFPTLVKELDKDGIFAAMKSDQGVLAMFAIAVSYCSRHQDGEYHIWCYGPATAGRHQLPSNKIEDVPELMQEPGWYIINFSLGQGKSFPVGGYYDNSIFHFFTGSIDNSSHQYRSVIPVPLNHISNVLNDILLLCTKDRLDSLIFGTSPIPIVESVIYVGTVKRSGDPTRMWCQSPQLNY